MRAVKPWNGRVRTSKVKPAITARCTFSTPVDVATMRSFPAVRNQPRLAPPSRRASSSEKSRFLVRSGRRFGLEKPG